MTIYEVLLIHGSITEFVDAAGFHITESGVLVFFDEDNNAFQAYNVPGGYIVRVNRKTGDKRTEE